MYERNTIGPVDLAATREVRAAMMHVAPQAKPHRSLYQKYAKYWLDAALVLLSAPITLPFILLMIFLIRRDGGPGLYAQDRVGRDGKTYRCYKLRTMSVNADAELGRYLQSCPEAREEWRVFQKLQNDPRVTPVGRLLRRSSLDELPQFWNVLRGEMSIVGPRPFLPSQRHLYSGRAYYEMRPGITGPWQVGDRNETTFAARVFYDEQYSERLSLFQDLSILFKTVGVVGLGKGS